MKTVLTFLSLTFGTLAADTTFAAETTMEVNQAVRVRDKGLYKSTKPAAHAYLRSIEDIKNDLLSSKGIFDGKTDFSVPVELQRKAVVVYRDEHRESVAE